MKNTLLFVLVLVTFVSAKAAPGDLDASFGNGGKAIADFGSGYVYEQAFDLALQADGKIVVAGYIATTTDSFAGIARFNANGTLDTGFGVNGRVLLPSGTVSAKSVEIQTDGKIVIGTLGGRIIRCQSDGSLDQTFGSGGIISPPYPYFFINFASLRLQADGKIVTAASNAGNFANQRNVVLFRYNADGTPDATFGDGGRSLSFPAQFPPQFNTPALRYMQLQPNGKIVVSGYEDNNSGFVARYNSDGTLDASFNATGYVVTIPTRPDGSAGDPTRFDSIAIQPNGKILVGGISYFSGDSSNSNDSIILRYNADGSLDSSFNGSGMVFTSILTDDRSIVGIVVQTNGKIVAAAGERTFNYQSSYRNFLNFDVIRYNANGSRDNSLWGTGGIVSTDFVNSEDQDAALKIQPDGKIVVAGSVRFSDNDSHFAVARYLGDLAPPTSANVSISGQVLSSNRQGISRVSVSLTDSSGNIRTAATNSFGNYRFEVIPAGQTYVISVNHKKYVFSPDSQVLNVSEDLRGIDFSANE